MDRDAPYEKGDRCVLGLALPTESSTSPRLPGKGNLDLNTSEVSSLDLISPRNKMNQIDSMEFEQSGNGGIMHSQSSQPRPDLVGLSQSSKDESSKNSRGRKATLTAAQKKEHKRLSDRNYREKKKNEMTLIKKRCEENHRLCGENHQLREEYDNLKIQVGRLSEKFEMLQNNQLFQAQDLLKSDSNFSRATSQPQDHRSVTFQDKQGKDSRAADRFSYEQMNHRSESPEKTISEGVVKNENLKENEENSQSGTCHVNELITKLLNKIDADDNSNVNFSNFTGLDGEKSRVGRYNFPSSLIPTVKRIIELHGDVSATSKLSPMVVESVYILFCASVKEMDELQIEQVTESKILKWRDTINDALNIGFKVEFAKEHLKKISRGYIGLKCKQELERVQASISKLELKLNAKREEHDKFCEENVPYTRSAEEFDSSHEGDDEF